MFGVFRKRRFLTQEEASWVFDVFEWLLRHTGGVSEFRHTRLVTPTPEDFPAPDAAMDDPHGLARYLFEQTKRHARMEDWPCRLESHQNAPQTSEMFGHIPYEGVGTAGAAGTFRLAPTQEVTITYASDSVANPMAFVGTMAHELSHYLMSSVPEDPPGGPEAEEPATDLCAVFLGFGIFTANSAVQFEQFQDSQMQGWSLQRQGYLSERAISFALAVFLDLLKIPAGEAKRHLDANPRSYVGSALREMRKHYPSQIERLRRVEATSTDLPA